MDEERLLHPAGIFKGKIEEIEGGGISAKGTLFLRLTIRLDDGTKFFMTVPGYPMGLKMLLFAKEFFKSQTYEFDVRHVVRKDTTYIDIRIK